jgi:hypothetical protein
MVIRFDQRNSLSDAVFRPESPADFRGMLPHSGIFKGLPDGCLQPVGAQSPGGYRRRAGMQFRDPLPPKWLIGGKS